MLIESCHHSLLDKSIEIKDKLLQKGCSGRILKILRKKIWEILQASFVIATVRIENEIIYQPSNSMNH